MGVVVGAGVHGVGPRQLRTHLLLAPGTSCFQRAGGLIKKPLPAYWTASISHRTLFLLHSVEMNQTPMDPIYFIQNRVL